MLVAGAPCFMGVLLTVYGAVSAGSAVALLPGLTSETFWPAVRRAGVTLAAMLKPTLADLLARPAADDLDHPLQLMAGSAAESERNAEAGRRFGVHWVCGLGKTEVCGAVGTGIDPSAAESVGKVRPPFIGRIVQPTTGQVVPCGGAGELVLRCEVEGGLPAGYADDPRATAELWRDGWLHTGWHLREPNLVAGAEQADRSRADIDVVASACCVPWPDGRQARRWAAGLVAFYTTVRTYEPFFEFHGFLDEARRCQAAFRAGDERAMIDAVPDIMVDALTIAGTPDEVRERLRRYEGLADAIMLSPPTHYVPNEVTRSVQEELVTMVGGP